MAGESLPWLGIAVIVGVTSLELKDLCDTIRDMNALKRAFNPDLAPTEDEKTVCSIVVPTREEVWQTAKASPRVAWDKAREFAPSLDEMRDIDLRAIDWEGYGTAIGEGVAGAYRWTGDTIGDAIGATVDGGKGLWGWLTEEEEDKPVD